MASNVEETWIAAHMDLVYQDPDNELDKLHILIALIRHGGEKAAQKLIDDFARKHGLPEIEVRRYPDIIYSAFLRVDTYVDPREIAEYVKAHNLTPTSEFYEQAREDIRRESLRAADNPYA